MQDGESPTDECFLCEPNEQWVWAETDGFFAMVALGPIVEGMSIVASRAHAKSMFDLPDELSDGLTAFTRSTQAHLEETFDSPVHVTEHGRVGLCEFSSGRHDQHCFHAHRLLFPTSASLSSALQDSVIQPLRATSFAEARQMGGHLVEYLYYEAPDGSILVGSNAESTPRQFFRGVVAGAVGRPELRSWRANPQHDFVNATRERLRA